MRTTIHLNDDLFARLKEASAKTGRTMTSIIEDALRQSLSQPRKGARKHVPLTTFGGTGVKPGVDLDDTASLLGLMDKS
jgi:hypothetical protein